MNLHDYLNPLDDQREPMTELLRHFADISSGSRNLPGLSRMADAIVEQFSSLEGNIRIIDLPEEQTIDSRGKIALHQLGRLVLSHKRPDASRRVLLNIH